MPGAVVAVLICVWYYQTATKLNINPLPWIVGALIIYYGLKYGWTYGVMKRMFSMKSMSPFINDLSGAAVGLIGAALFNFKVLQKQKPSQ